MLNVPRSELCHPHLAFAVRGLSITSLVFILCGCSGSSQAPPADTDRPKNDPVTARSAAVDSDDESGTAGVFRLTSIADEWGIVFQDAPRNPAAYDDTVIVGAGCAICDVNHDHLQDVLLVGTEAAAAGETGKPEAPRVALFLQVSAGQFRNATVESGLGKCLGGIGVAFGDCTNDGSPDLLLTSAKTIGLWINDGHGHFKEATEVSGLRHSGWAIAATWFDYDRDGWLDLFVTGYLEHQTRPCSSLSGGHRDFCSPLLFQPTVDRLFRNVSGDSPKESLSAETPQFEDVTMESGIGASATAGMGVLAADLTDDGWPDIYVASDQRPNRLWVNQKNGRFTDQAPLMGCDGDFLGRMQASMGIALGAVSAPAHEDVVVSHLSGEFHAIYSATGNGMYLDRSRETGVGNETRPFTGFGIAVLDLNSDGANELITANGRVIRPDGVVEDKSDFWEPYREPVQILSPQGGVYEHVEWGQSNSRRVARGLAAGDLDSDGDMDVVLTTLDGSALVLRNDSLLAGNWIALRGVDPGRGDRSCPGAKISVHRGGEEIRRTLQPCQSYASTHQDLIHIGLGEIETIEFIDVVWPHGELKRERFFPDPEHGFLIVNKVHTLKCGTGERIE